MPKPTASAATPSAASDSVPAINLPVVTRCWDAHNRAYKAATDSGKTGYSALPLARQAYSRCMPAPLDPKSVSEFVACVTFGAAVGVFDTKQSNTLLYAAQVALSLHRRAESGEKKSGAQKVNGRAEG